MSELYDTARRYAHDSLAEYDGQVSEGLYPPLAGNQRKCIEDKLAIAWLDGGLHAYGAATAMVGKPAVADSPGEHPDSSDGGI